MKRTIPSLPHLRHADSHLLRFKKFFALQMANRLSSPSCFQMRVWTSTA
jgi:hypothetical protein